ncbi:MAG: hypothetical protein KDK38_09230 [Leptospiraceae bacterium]|nr:hypothetical protein [Leptospiraceae bacterium]
MSLRFVKYLSALSAGWLYSSCCSIVIPPVTLTGNKTAMEKQIIGEKAELEKDVWMIASARTTSRNDLAELSEEQQESIVKENNLTNKALVLMDVFLPKLQILKADLVVGENKEGFISDLTLENSIIIASEIKRKYNPELEEDPEEGEPYRMLKETVIKINEARDLMIRGYIENQRRNKPDIKINEQEIREMFRKKFHDSALRGEYVQSAGGVWAKK